MRRIVVASATIMAMAAIAAGCAGGRAGQATPAADATPSDAPGRAAHEAAEARRLVERAEEALRANRAAEAEALYLDAIEETAPEARTLNGLARARITLGKRDAALADLERSVAIAETAEALALRGRLLALARRFDEAERGLQRAVELAPDDAFAWAVLGAVQVNRGDDVEAQRALAATVRLLGPTRGPDRLWTQLLSMPPDPVHPQESLDRCTRGRVALLQGLWVDAHAEHLNGLRYSRQFLWCIAGLAESTWRVGALEQAERSLRAVVRDYPEALAPLRADAQGTLAAVLLARGRHETEAAALARRALEVRGERAALLDVLARACDASGDQACAADAYTRLLRRPHLPDSMRAHAERRSRELAAGGASPPPSRS